MSCCTGSQLPKPSDYIIKEVNTCDITGNIIINCCIFGKRNCGKTSFFNRLIYDEFYEDMVPTIGSDVREIKTEIKEGGDLNQMIPSDSLYQDGNIPYIIRLIDLEGKRTFTDLWSMYAKIYKCNIAIYVIDATDQKTNIDDIKQYVKEFTILDFKVIIIFTKVDFFLDPLTATDPHVISLANNYKKITDEIYKTLQEFSIQLISFSSKSPQKNIINEIGAKINKLSTNIILEMKDIVLPSEFRNYERKIKLVVLGEIGCGKTTFLTCAKYQVVDKEKIRSTVGIDYFGITLVKKIQVKNRNGNISTEIININLQMWDTAGQERYHAISDNYCRDADIILLFSEASKRDSEATKKNLDLYNKRLETTHANISIVYTKSDLLLDKDKNLAMLPNFFTMNNPKKIAKYIENLVLSNVK